MDVYGIWLRFWCSGFALQGFDQIVSRKSTPHKDEELNLFACSSYLKLNVMLFKKNTSSHVVGVDLVDLHRFRPWFVGGILQLKVIHLNPNVRIAHTLKSDGWKITFL